MRDSDFQFVQTFLRKHAAISLDENKQYLVESRLEPLATREGLDSLEKLVTRLRFQSTRQLERQVVEAMTTNETSWFRDPNVYKALEEHILPAAIERQRGTKRLRIWSGACSTGQEPYTIAMILRERFGHILQGWDVKITATDIDTKVLATCEEGVYGKLAVNRGLPARMLVSYFENRGMNWQVKDTLKELIDFKQLNLAEAWPLRGPFDLILIRNVLIYFDRETKRDILSRAQRLLAPGAVLMLGTAETTLSIIDTFERTKIGNAIAYLPKAKAA